eukprot:GDKH01005213.1.p2 GENE.GDKH01005213.1~~GDKH01005213.1.p2  ORF type:complete len:121 (-),score=10.31 GDKH01005213.1:313-675(-)
MSNMWHQWFPYEAKPLNPMSDPLYVKIKGQTMYWWCACGRSAKQPWCDGAHKGTGFKPVEFHLPFNSHRLLCGCKMSEYAPYCFGSCFWLKAKQNTPKTLAGFFLTGVLGGFIGTYHIHP